MKTEHFVLSQIADIKAGPQAKVAAAAAAGRGHERWRCTVPPSHATRASSVRFSPSSAPIAAGGSLVSVSACSLFSCSLSNFSVISSLRRFSLLVGALSFAAILESRPNDDVQPLPWIQGMMIVSLPGIRGAPLPSSIPNRFLVASEELLIVVLFHVQWCFT